MRKSDEELIPAPQCQFPRKNLIGTKFGRLTIQSFAGRNKAGRAFWLCLCDCGNPHTLNDSTLKVGGSISCGCFRREHSGQQKRRHGMEGTPTYRAWAALKTRCLNPKMKGFHHYGGRGVKVCERWLNSFENFLADMGERPEGKYSLDRFPDQNGNYEPGNCRWATWIEQANNKRTNRIVEINGISQTLAQHARALGISPERLSNRLKRGIAITP